MDSGGDNFEQEFANKVKQEVVARQEREEQKAERNERKKIIAVIMLAVAVVAGVALSISITAANEMKELTIAGRWQCGEVVYEFNEDGSFEMSGEDFAASGTYRFGGEAAQTVAFDVRENSLLNVSDFRYVAPMVVRFGDGGGFDLVEIGGDGTLTCARV
jgi:hypothetical protein